VAAYLLGCYIKKLVIEEEISVACLGVMYVSFGDVRFKRWKHFSLKQKSGMA